MHRLRSLDLRFINDHEEVSFQAMREPDLLRWTRLGAIVFGICTVVHGFSTIGPEAFGQVLLLRIHTVQSKVVLCQQLIWSVCCLIVTGLTSLRLACGFFRCWNWELVITCVMAYGVCAIIVGQTFSLTTLMGEDPLVWDEQVLYTYEAWALLGLNTMTTATSFFLPIRSIVSWTVPAVGVVSYACTMPFSGFEHVARTLVLIALSYIAWCGAWQTEKHMRTEFAAVRQVERSSSMLEDRNVLIRDKSKEIDRQEDEIREKDGLAKSLLMVSRALCDTMVQLDANLCILSTEADQDVFFEEVMVGKPFTELLIDEDKVRFAACVQRARVSEMPELLPVTLHRRYTTSEANLLLVARSNFRAEYVLGIRVERDHPVAGSFHRGWGNSSPDGRPDSCADLQRFSSEDPQEDPSPPARPPGLVPAPGSLPGTIPDANSPRSGSIPDVSEFPSPCRAENFNSRGGCSDIWDEEKGAPPAPPEARQPRHPLQQQQQQHQQQQHQQPGDIDDDTSEGRSPSSQSGQQYSGVLPQPVPHPALRRSLTMRSIEENAESDFSFTTHARKEKADIRPPKTTSVKARARTLNLILKRWCVPRKIKSCCHYHTVLDSVEEVLDHLFQDNFCDALFSSFPEQCPRCSCMNHGTSCSVCGLSFSSDIS